MANENGSYQLLTGMNKISCSFSELAKKSISLMPKCQKKFYNIPALIFPLATSQTGDSGEKMMPMRVKSGTAVQT